MPLKRTTDDATPLNLTPMIDVVFLLVIFFMTATQFAEVERAVELELPTVAEEGTSVATPDQPQVVTIDAAGGVTLNGAPRSLEELTADLKGLREADASTTGPEVLIHGDARCDFQHVAAAMAACRAARIANVGVTVEAATTLR